MKNSCSRTILGCYVGYIVQAIVNNFVPLLFVMFERTYQIPLSKSRCSSRSISAFSSALICFLRGFWIASVTARLFCCRTSPQLPDLSC